VSTLTRFESIQAGDALPEREFNIGNAQLFLYNAVIWNAHRIHYDHPYATGVEGYPGLVNAGPLMGDWLTQCVLEWLGDDGDMLSFEYSNRQASMIGETLHSGGRVVSVDADTLMVTLELFLTNETGAVIAPGTATVRFSGH
jgi:hydroxyacyl-ACP dehydratase HTD2-like protein with hotdog domain